MPDEGFEGFVPFPSDLAVEIVSPGDAVEEVRAKAREYLANGVVTVWTLCPARRSVTVQPRTGTAHEFGPDDTLDGGQVFPGFYARVRDLFDVQARR